MSPTLALSILLASSPANAGKCDSLISKADSAQGDALVRAFTDLAKCDSKIAEQNYLRFMSGAKEADTLVALSQAAILWEVWNPVWEELSKITSYDARDEVAQRVGEACNDQSKVVPFLQGAYFGLRNIDFQQWDDAFIACDNADLQKWITQQVENPPKSSFNEKYNTILSIHVKKLGSAALPSLTTAAIKAAAEGPYDQILMQLDESVAPPLGRQMPEEDKKALEASLIEIAKGVNPDRARAVAERLAAAGSVEVAAQLLTVIYADRVQPGGGFLYGAASMEAGECKGVKTVYMHYSNVTDPGKRWSVNEEVAAPMLAAKPKLKKCTVEEGPWPVAATAEPLASSKDVTAWVEEISRQWKDKGYEIKLAPERQIDLH